MIKIHPSLISADLMNLRSAIQLLDPHTDGYHIDIMDNHFVPNLTWGAQFVNAIAQETAKPLTVHLMVDNPTNWIDKFTINDHSSIIIHIESKGEIRKNLETIRKRKHHPGISLNPKTPVEQIFPVLDLVDTVLIMTVEPGFSGQSFIKGTEKKVEPLVGYKQTNGLNFSIGMDGGVNKENIKLLIEKGVDWFGIASAIFNQPNYVKAFQELKKIVV